MHSLFESSAQWLYGHVYGTMVSDSDSSRWEVVNVHPRPSRHTSPQSLCCDPHRLHYKSEGTLRHKVMTSLAVMLASIKRHS